MQTKLEIKIVTNHDNLASLLEMVLQDLKTGHYMEGKWHEIKERDKDYPSTVIYQVRQLDTGG